MTFWIQVSQVYWSGTFLWREKAVLSNDGVLCTPVFMCPLFQIIRSISTEQYVQWKIRVHHFQSFP